MKKLFSILLIVLFSFAIPFQGFALSWAEKSRLTKSVIISKSKLSKNLVTWSRYVRAINRLIEEKSNDREYLERLSVKLSEKRSEFANKDDTQSQKIVYVIDYIVAKANLAIAELSEADNIIDIENSNLTDEEKKEVEQRVLSLQWNLLKSSEDIFEILQKYTAYEQSGFAEMRLNIDEESFGTLMSELKITDYVSKNNLLDSQLTGDLEWRIEYSIASQDLKVEFSSFVDAIMKDGQFYVMLDKVKSTVETENPEISALADISKKISTEGKYVRFSDENLGDIDLSKEMIENVLNINKYRVLLEQPVFKAYKKDWNKYYVVPTQEFCSEAKKVFGGLLWNIGSSGCSESQYSDMVEWFLADTDAYMTMNWDTSKMYLEEKWWSSKINVSFDSQNITAAGMEIINNSQYNPSEMTMAYNRWKDINFFITSPEWNGTFNGVLDSNNRFESFKMIIDSWEDFQMNMALLNEKLEWNISASMDGQEIMKADISGTLEKDYLDMEMMFEFVDFIRGWDNIIWNTRIKADTRNNKNNLDMWIYIEQNDKNIVEFEILSESTIKYWEVEIKAPTDFVEAETVWPQEEFNEIY